MTSLIVTEKPYWGRLTIYHGEDWQLPVPQITNPYDGSALDLTDITFELFCRPSLNHETLLLFATSIGEAGIVKENAAEGLIAFFKSQAAVEDALPVTTRDPGWAQFLRMTFDTPDFGLVTKHLWLGPLLVFPARDSGT